jgi:hypothetical protein
MLLVDLLGCGSAAAQVDGPQQPDIPTVTITAKPAGPPLWKITRGPNTLWLFAALPVVPEDLDWDSSRVEHIVSEAEVFLTMPRVKAGGIGALLTMRTRNLGALIGELQRWGSDGALDKAIDPAIYHRLSESVPPEFLHELRQYKPWFAGRRLMDFWIKREGFTNNGNIKPDRELERLRRKHRVRKVTSDVDVELEELERHLQQQLSLPADVGIACLASALDFHEDAEDLKRTLTRWFAGEIPLSSALDPLQACFNEAPLLNRHNMEQAIQIWKDNVEQALASHKVSFAVVPVGFLLDENHASFRQWLEQQGLDISHINDDH